MYELMSKIPKHNAMKAYRSVEVQLHEFCNLFVCVDNLLSLRFLISISKGENSVTYQVGGRMGTEGGLNGKQNKSAPVRK
jgi:hypothetical protein